MMEMARQLAKADLNLLDSATPSSQIPAYSKASSPNRGNPRSRVIEDIPEGIKPVVTQHIIHG